MKNKSVILFAVSAVALLFSSCEINDLIADRAEVGHMAPTVYWDLPSTAAAAGDNVQFIGQYYTSNKTAQIDHLELWYSVLEDVSTSVSCPLVSSTLKFTMATSAATTTRDEQLIESYPHSIFKYDSLKLAFQVDTVFPTPRTLTTVAWNEVKDWDQAKFDRYFPTDLPQTFKDSLFNLCGVNEFRSIMVKLELMDSKHFIACTDSMIDPNTMKYVYSIKPDSLPVIVNYYNGIPFTDLIYNDALSTYSISYEKIFKLNTTLRVIDSDGIIGKSETKLVELR